MTLTVNQVLMILLILVLVALVVVVAIMAKHALELIAKCKVLVDDSQGIIDDTKVKIGEAEDKILGAATSIAEDTAPAIKALGATAGGLTAINLVSLVGKSLAESGGAFVSGERRARKKASKELKRSKRMIKKVNKQAKAEKKAIRKTRKISRKARRAEAKIDRKTQKRARKAAKKAAREAKKS